MSARLDALDEIGLLGDIQLTDHVIVVVAPIDSEIHHIAGNTHDDGLLMVDVPDKRLLTQADTFTPSPANTPPPMPPSPFTVNLADNVARLGLTVDRLLPLHGRIVPLADLSVADGRAN